jgi:hypothetical protein
MINNYKERLKSLFTKKPNYKELYEEERKTAERFEFKYNKLRRQLKAILTEADA